MGQAKKLRNCPAVGRDITSAECGENRHGRYACPEGCPFNPFASVNYRALLELEDALDDILIERLGAADPAVQDRLRAAHRAKGAHGLHAATVWEVFFQHDAQGRTLAERWVEEAWQELRSDERTLLRGKMQMRVVLLETRRVWDEQRFEAIDLLEPEAGPHLYLDRSLGARAVRFTTLLGWYYPLPHFRRLAGTALALDDVSPFPVREMIETLIVHLGGPAEVSARRRWLAENFVRIDEALTATGLERRRRMFTEMDASFVAATYALRVPPEEIRALLATVPGVQEEEPYTDARAQGFRQAWAWFDDQPAPGRGFANAAGGQVVLGRVLVGENECRVEGIGAKRISRLRAAFEARFGERVVFTRERRDDIGASYAAKEPVPDLTLVPPRLLERIEGVDFSSSRVAPPPPGVSVQAHLAAVEREYLKTWPNSPLPALDGLTPRAAVRDPAWRLEVIELVKRQVRKVDAQNLESGRNEDINFLIRDLGLTEIDVPPPPPRPRVPKPGPRKPPAAGAAAESAEVEFTPETARSAALRPAAPRLEGPPLAEAEAQRRLTAAAREYEYAADAMEELAASGATLTDDLAALTKEMLSDNEYSFLLAWAYQAWFALVPRGVRAPSLDFEAMVADFNATGDRVSQATVSNAAKFDLLKQACRQPALLEAIVARLLDGVQRVPKQYAVAKEAVPVMLVALKALLDELDRALGRG